MVAVHGACNAMSHDQRFELIIIITRLCILVILVRGLAVSGLRANKPNCNDVDDNFNKRTDASPALLVCCVSMLSHINYTVYEDTYL